MKKIINGINSSNDLRVICLNLNERIDHCERGVHHTGISDFFLMGFHQWFRMMKNTIDLLCLQ